MSTTYDLALRFLGAGGHVSWAEFSDLPVEDQAAFAAAGAELRAQDARATVAAFLNALGETDEVAQVGVQTAADLALQVLKSRRAS